MASDGAPQADPMLSRSSSRDSDMASKLQNATSLTIRALQEMTKDFSEERKIGQGAYGKVYVATLENGENIAVKMLHNNMPGIDDEQFQREFENLMRLEHHNIVRLVAYCYETQHQPMEYMGRTIFAERTYRALCFEYMENGSLETYISDECDGLDWLTRFKIIKGTWNGLKHLHEGSGQPIFHLDLKPDNILLDNNMVPKLADFGLSKLFGDKQTMTTQTPIGTIGYLPMEYLHGNIISNKFDIFSLGVVMIKIIAGHGGYSRSAEMPRQEFLDQVHANWRNRMLKTCQASRLLEAYCEQVNICTEIALSCMEIDRHKRPNIADIVHGLDDTEAAIDMALSWKESTQPLINEGSVKLEAFTGSEVIPYAERGDEYPILVRVTAPPWRHAEPMPRPAVDLVVVYGKLDSRLLGESKALYIIQQSLIVVIDKLGSNDRLSIVSGYGECIMKLTFMSDQGRDVARLIVDGLKRKNVGVAACLEEGAKVLRGRELEEGDSRLGFILVLLNEFMTDSDKLLVPEISSEFPVHIIGYKPCQDATTRVMKDIASKTSGTYSYIERIDTSDYMYDITGTLDVFIGGITMIAATSIKITLTAHEGIAISSIESGRYNSRVNSEEQSGEIDINDIYAGETKNFIIKLKLSEGKAKLVTVGGHYWSLGESKQLADTDMFAPRPRYGCTRRKLDMHPEVAAELVRVQILKGVLAAMQERGVSKLEQDPESLLAKIRSSEEGQRAPKKIRQGLFWNLEGMHHEMRCRIGGEQVLRFTMSWLSCHEWQRATTKDRSSHLSGTFARKC